MNKAFFTTANKYTSLLDIDYKLIDIEKFMKRNSIKFIEESKQFNLKDICQFGFQIYLSLGVLSNKDAITKCFDECILNDLLTETEVESFLQKDYLTHEKMANNYDANKLLSLSDNDLNSFAERQIEILRYQGSMSFDLSADYDLAERIIDYCSGRITYKNRLNLLRALGAFCMYFKRFDSGKKHLFECINIMNLAGDNSEHAKLFLSEVYNDLAIIESTNTNPDLNKALDYSNKDIKLKKQANADKLSLGKSINLNATILKELDPINSLPMYIESDNLKAEYYNDNPNENTLISWMLTTFNVGLVAKDLLIYDEALRIISKANKVRMKYMKKSSKNYCSSINVECELKILLGQDVATDELIEAIQSRVDLPDGYIETKEHTWYVCALYYYENKSYIESINYINRALLAISEGNVISDVRQEVRLLQLLAKVNYEIAKENNDDFSVVKDIYIKAAQKIINNYGNDSIYLMEIYNDLQKIDENYIDKYNLLKNKYCEELKKARIVLENYDFEVNEQLF